MTTATYAVGKKPDRSCMTLEAAVRIAKYLFASGFIWQQNGRRWVVIANYNEAGEIYEGREQVNLIADRNTPSTKEPEECPT